MSNRAHLVYDILVAHAGAPESDRESFVLWFDEQRGTEYRFQGRLGFGGKLRRREGRLSVDCYPEDATPERSAIIERTNDALSLLVQGPSHP